jgi:hypothetical protein
VRLIGGGVVGGGAGACNAGRLQVQHSGSMIVHILPRTGHSLRASVLELPVGSGSEEGGIGRHSRVYTMRLPFAGLEAWQQLQWWVQPSRLPQVAAPSLLQRLALQPQPPLLTLPPG